MPQAIIARLKSDLGIDAALPLPSAVAKACELLGIEGQGPLIAQARALNSGAMESVRLKTARVQKELALPSTLSIRDTLAQANKVLGVAQQGAIPRQLERLYKLIGLSGA